jgi:hypothetical protein
MIGHDGAEHLPRHLPLIVHGSIHGILAPNSHVQVLMMSGTNDDVVRAIKA